MTFHPSRRVRKVRRPLNLDPTVTACAGRRRRRVIASFSYGGKQTWTMDFPWSALSPTRAIFCDAVWGKTLWCMYDVIGHSVDRSVAADGRASARADDEADGDDARAAFLRRRTWSHGA